MVFKLGYVSPLEYMKTVLKESETFLHLPLPCTCFPNSGVPEMSLFFSLPQVGTLLSHTRSSHWGIKPLGHEKGETLLASWSWCKEMYKK